MSEIHKVGFRIEAPELAPCDCNNGVRHGIFYEQVCDRCWGTGLVLPDGLAMTEEQALATFPRLLIALRKENAELRERLARPRFDGSDVGSKID